MNSKYMCYFVDRDQRIVGRQDFFANNDAEAIGAAKGLSSRHDTPQFELWEGFRCVHSAAVKEAGGEGDSSNGRSLLGSRVV